MSMSNVAARDPVTIAELVEALRVQQGRAEDTLAAKVEDLTRSASTADASNTVLVLGAHPGAGASVVALALADALASAHQLTGASGVRLVDTAAQDESGLAGAIQREIAGRDEHWRLGCRGPVIVLRPVVSVTSALDLPQFPLAWTGLTVVDAGWSLGQISAGANPLTVLIEEERAVVVVGRASVPGVRRMELVLATLPARPIVAAVGSRRWARTVVASWGPRLAQAVREDRVVLVPSVRRVEVNGVDAEPLPRPLTEAGARLITLLWPGGLGLSGTSGRGGVGR